MSTQNNQNNKIIFVQAQHPFDRLTEAELKRLEQSIEPVDYPSGAHILAQDGPPSRYLYVIRKGSIRLVRDGQVIEVLRKGQFFGYRSMLNQKSSYYEVVAEEDTLIYSIPEEVFHTLINNATFAEFFLRDLSKRLHNATRDETLTLAGNLTTLVDDLLSRPPVNVSPTATVAEAAEVMHRACVDAALVTSQPRGIITDQDFMVRVMAQGLGPETLVETVMTQPVKTSPVDTPVYSALGSMLEHNINHLALARDGRIVGVITSDDLLRHEAKNPLYFLRQLEHSGDLAKTLPRYVLDVAGTVETLYKGGLDVAQIGRIIANLNATLVRRLLKAAEQELGPAPTPYAWMVFGSEGRMEQMLLTDQDNALVFKEDKAEYRKYFKILAERVVGGLIRAGFPPCPGGYMATNWCRPLDDWVKLFRRWVSTPEPQALLEACIFFDFRSVYGELSLEPLERILFGTGKQSIFLAHMSRTALEFRPPLSLFRRIRDENGQVDIKKGGVAPIVAIARFYALEAGMRSRSTFKRLKAAAAAGKLSRDGAENLSDTYRFLLKLNLKEQLAELKAGETPDNKIRLQSLSALENRRLKENFMGIRLIQESISQRF